MKRTLQQSLLGFFPKKGKTNDEPNPQNDKILTTPSMDISTDGDAPTPSTSDRNREPSNAGLDSGMDYDFGKYLSNNPKNDEEKLTVLKETWTPPETFKFPVCGKRKLCFQRHWTQKNPWLVYSNMLQGSLCKMCVLFGQTEGGRGDQKLGSFVTKPFNNWKKALEKMEHHRNTNYHKYAVERARNFVSVMEGQTRDITESFNEENKKIARENRERLCAIVDTILFCGRQKLPLRGNQDSGEIGIIDPLHNDGNFRALLRFRAQAGDEVLKNHLISQSNHSRAMYTSSVIQNEIIDLCGNAVQEQIINRVKQSGFFAVLADETQDISRHQQLSLCLRYVDCSSGKALIREDFIEFIHVDEVTGLALATTIIDKLKSFGLDLENLVGQGYDGAAVMSGRFKGVRTIIMDKYPRALFVHCVAHTLNLVLGHSCEIPAIRNCIGTIKSIINFFRQSALRDGLLKRTADEIEAPHSMLISLCETRWTEKHTAVERFAEMFPVVNSVLQELQESGREIATQAYQLQVAMENSQFIVSLTILRKVFSYTSSLNRTLQKVNVDLTDSCSYVKTIKTTLQNLRNEREFSNLFEEAKKLISADITVPRVSRRQLNRNNIPGDTAEVYYRRNIFYPFIQHVVTELDARFKPHEEAISGIQLLLPDRTQNTERAKKCIAGIGEIFLREVEIKHLVSEYELWHNHWCNQEQPSTALEAMDRRDEIFFPTVRKLLQILATLPVSTATPERTFSSLKRLKTYLRNRMGDERLTGLALMSIHRNVTIGLNSSEIVNKLAERRKRMNLIL
ncbi:52 kDa repressor of the inhibitor of the protein kinase-like [Diabrotica undecimpunctata]|uniref:52 kDa repressor of the inhibitor of the protein kinase-like n=1 Tax=Diabrotica undecimpunctata TaxID=50387 RepID=UPI003B63EF37